MTFKTYAVILGIQHYLQPKGTLCLRYDNEDVGNLVCEVSKIRYSELVHHT